MEGGGEDGNRGPGRGNSSKAGRASVSARREAGEFRRRRCVGVRPWGEEVTESFRVGVYTLTLKDCS